MCDILAQTFASAEAFWTAVAALAAVIALAFLALEFPKLKREMALHKVEGFKYASEQLLAADFREWMQLALDFWKRGGDAFPEEIYGELTAIFGRLDFLDKLLELGFADNALLLYVFHDDLSSLEAAIRNFETRSDSKIPNIAASYPGGYRLLKDGSRYARGFSQKAFARLRTRAE
jgi:hypothetical protein